MRREGLLDQLAGALGAEFVLHPAHLRGRRRGVDQNRAGCMLRAPRRAPRRPARGRRARLSGSRRKDGRCACQRATCPLVAVEQLPDRTAAVPCTRGSVRPRRRARAARPCGSGRPCRGRCPSRPSPGAGRRRPRRWCADRRRPARRRRRCRRRPAAGAAMPRAHRSRAFGNRRVADQADLAPRLAAQHAHQVGVRHRRERMILHAGFGEQLVADEQVAAGRWCGRSPGKAGQAMVKSACKASHQGVGDRADVAPRRGVEGRAILEIELPAAGRLQPGERRQRLLDRLLRWNGARLEGHHDGVDVLGERRRAARRWSGWCACRRAPACWRGRWRR